MVVYEVISDKKSETKKIFVVNYRKGDERLFPVDFTEAQFVEDEVVINITTKTNIRRYTESGFMMQQFHWGDQVILTPDGDWKCRHSLSSYAVALCSQLSLFCKEIAFQVKRVLKGENLGMIQRKVQQNCSFINILQDINIE